MGTLLTDSQNLRKPQVESRWAKPSISIRHQPTDESFKYARPSLSTAHHRAIQPETIAI